jgi:molybdate transport system ATP-binding protein
MPVVTPHELFINPRTVFAARLSGCKNIIAVTPEGSSVFAENWGVKLECGQSVDGDVAAVGLRAHHLFFTTEDASNVIPCRVVRSMDNVFSTIVILRPECSRPDASTLRIELAKENLPELHERMFVAIEPQNILLLK